MRKLLPGDTFLPSRVIAIRENTKGSDGVFMLVCDDRQTDDEYIEDSEFYWIDMRDWRRASPVYYTLSDATQQMGKETDTTVYMLDMHDLLIRTHDRVSIISAGEEQRLYGVKFGMVYDD